MVQKKSSFFFCFLSISRWLFGGSEILLQPNISSFPVWFLSFLLCSHPKIFLKHQSDHTPPLTKIFQGLFLGGKSHLLLVLHVHKHTHIHSGFWPRQAIVLSTFHLAPSAWPVSPPCLTPPHVHHRSPSSDRTTSCAAPGPRGSAVV